MLQTQGQVLRSQQPTLCLLHRSNCAEQRGLSCHTNRLPSCNPAQRLKSRQASGVSARSRAAVAIFSADRLPGLGGGEVFIAGGTSPLALRIGQQLLKQGSKVSAGVLDVEAAKELLEFAKKFELLDKKQAQNIRLVEIDQQDVESSLPGRATIVLLPGDSPNGLDNRTIQSIISAAEEGGAGKIILVQPKDSGGGGLFGLFGGGGGGSRQLEQAVADSGVKFAIIRIAKQVVDSPESQGSIGLGPQSSLPSGSSITKGQVAEVVAAVLQQASDDVLVEAWADPSAEATPLSDLVAEVLPAAVVADEEDDAPQPQEAEEEPEPVAQIQRAGRRAAQVLPAEEEVEEEAQSAKKGLFSFGKRKSQEVQEEAEEAGEEAKAKGRGLFGLGAKKKQEVQEEVEDIGQEAKSKGGGLFGFGGKKKPAEEQAPAPKPSRGAFGFGGGKKQEQQEEEPEAASNGNPLAGLFGGGSKSRQDDGASPALKARKSADRKVAAGVGAAKRAGRAGREAAEEGPEKKTGGFFSALGFGQQAQYDDEE